MRVAILDLLYDRVPHRSVDPYGAYFRKQFTGIMPQTVAVWCRQLGHKVHYTTYWGQADPVSLLPNDIDVLFVSSYTQSSALAYAIATVFKRRNTLTVLGGPHARSFPTDSMRFFDIVVKDCDRPLIADILNKRFDPPLIVSSARPLSDFPSVEERIEEIRVASFYGSRPSAASTVPMLASIGCPYNCDFCVDWNSTYVTLPTDRLHADLAFLSRHYPALLIAFHDPNFAVRFDTIMDIIERIPAGRRNRYIMECSLSILKTWRLKRLAETNCAYVAPGIESWTEYSNKAGTGNATGRDKLEKVITRLELIGEHVPGIQANLLFGADSDRGDEPVTLTKEFIRRLPDVWPTINIPTPFGGTPLYDQLYREGRILREMPFMFYSKPYVPITVKHYHPIAFYDHVIDLLSATASWAMLVRRIAGRAPRRIRFIHAVRAISNRSEMAELRRIRSMLASDSQFRSFHEGRSPGLPAFYERLFNRHLGRLAETLPHQMRQPVLELPASAPATGPVLAEAEPGLDALPIGS